MFKTAAMTLLVAAIACIFLYPFTAKFLDGIYAHLPLGSVLVASVKSGILHLVGFCLVAAIIIILVALL